MFEVTHITPLGQLYVRKTLPDGTFHRHVVSPGDDLAQEDVVVQIKAASVWTADVIQAHADMLATRSV